MTHLQNNKPIHWTYEEFSQDSDLQQGDILDSTDEVHTLCQRIHPYFCNPKFLGFMIVTQSCDLVRRKGNNCNAHYINLAVIRSLEEILPIFLDSVCVQVASCTYTASSKDEANKLLSRIFNQNEQALGLFYLHPDEQAGIAVPSVALLRVSVSFCAEHYDIIQSARRGRLNSEFRSKLGWLAGNLFSRIGTTDWTESRERKKQIDTLIGSFLTPDKESKSENSPLWVDEVGANSAINSGINLKELARGKLISVIREHTPPRPKEEVINSVIQTLKKVMPVVTDQDLEKIRNRLINDESLKAALKRVSRERNYS